MLGNDIIDLDKATIGHDWQRKGYLEKVYTPSEKRLILASADSSTTVWLLWSMKEAAYKIVNRTSTQRFYAPQLFECELSYTSATKANGCVTYNNEKFYTQSEITAQLLHTIAVGQKEQFPLLRTVFMSNSPDYLNLFNALSKNYQLFKNAFGIPEIINTTDQEVFAASVSHHGNYLAVAYAKAH